MAKNNKEVPSVLSFEKKLAASDAFLYGTVWDGRDKAPAEALPLIEKSVRGTISNRLKAALENNQTKLDAAVENANLQTADACALGEHQDTLKTVFTLKVLGGLAEPSACNNQSFYESYREVVRRYAETYGFRELAARYTGNIANARFLWRNRVGAEQVEVRVKAAGKLWTFDAFEMPFNDFDSSHDKLQELAGLIAQALRGELPYLLLEIEAYAKIGRAQEVYPSEELVLDKGKGKKSKILYQVGGNAALHSQKVGNALRTIDTWYKEYGDRKKPIAVEPYGSVTNLGRAFRSPKDKADFYTLFDQYALGEPLEREEDEHYVMAVLIRGGVFGQAAKDD